jgi:hypothetical protein
MRVNLPDARDLADLLGKTIENLREVEQYIEFEKKTQKTDRLGSAVDTFDASDMLVTLYEARNMLQYIYNMLDSLALLFQMVRKP